MNTLAKGVSYQSNLLAKCQSSVTWHDEAEHERKFKKRKHPVAQEKLQSDRQNRRELLVYHDDDDEFLMKRTSQL